jgi:hypothetical protein
MNENSKNSPMIDGEKNIAEGFHLEAPGFHLIS